ncbi:MAG: DNA-processing protein DprA [Candidatus Uhrbacteria bacterium]
MDEHAPWFGLAALVDEVGSRNFARLIIAADGDVERAWHAPKTLLARAGFSESTADRFLSSRGSIDPAALAATAVRNGMTCIPLNDPQYPTLLKTISDPPIALFVRGAIELLAQRAVAFVGTRRCTPYGITVTEMLTKPLARSGIVITSGLAYGIDAAAHGACLSENGRTIAILGTGIDDASVYPTVHRSLARRILDGGGLLLSEYPPGTDGRPMHFPARNRIIAGTTVATLVIEAPKNSGALITAEFAMDFGREVLAVPGPITSPTSAGTNALIRNGATPITSADDLLDALNLRELFPPVPVHPAPPSGDARRVWEILKSEPTHIDDLCTRLEISVSELSVHLTSLELDGAIREVGGGRYVRL